MRVCYISGFNFKSSGYFNIGVDTCKGLAELGHEVTVLGLEYGGDEHSFPFSIIPAKTISDSLAQLQNFVTLRMVDVLVVAGDIPIQLNYLNATKKFRDVLPYVAITAMENGPLMSSWALGLYDANFVFFISELGKQEALKAGLENVDHLQVGIDLEKWKWVDEETKKTMKVAAGYKEDDHILLTVAANQERKNLWAGMEAVRLLKEEYEIDVKYLLVTMRGYQNGWNLDDLAFSMGINDRVHIYERGMSQEQLNVLYNIADAFVLPTKAEGLGLPILESMATKVPVYATDTGACTELLDGDRGYLIPFDYEFIDVWGNSTRRMISPEMLAHSLMEQVDVIINLASGTL